MKRILMATVFMAVSLPAMANGPQVGGDVSIPAGLTNGNFQNGVNSAISTGQIGSNSTARSRSNATGGAGGMGGAGGQGGRANASGGASSVTNNIGNGSGGLFGSQPNDVTVRSAPNLSTGNVFSANNCGVGGGGGGSWIAAAFSLNFLWDGSECRNQEWYRLYMLTGNGAAAKESACLVSSQRQVFMNIGDPCRQDMPRQSAAPVQQVAMPIPKPAFCAPVRGESTADRLMRQQNEACR